MRLGFSPEGCTKPDKEVFLKKSDKITFSKINFLPFKPKGNTRFLKNYGIAVFFLLIFIIKEILYLEKTEKAEYFL